MFEIREVNGRFRVMHDGEMLSANFHRAEQAQKFVDRELEKIRLRYRSRTSQDPNANLPNIYGDNLQNRPV